MELPSTAQWRRKASLRLVQGDRALDLSDFAFTFETSAADLESPNNCQIRVFNLTDDTMAQAQREFGTVVVQAGYEGDNFGVVFQGTIRWFRRGKSDNKNVYLDVLAADGDLGYNAAFVNQSLARGSRPSDQLQIIDQAFQGLGLSIAHNGISPGDAQALSRGKVMFGLARTALGTVSRTYGSTWSIQNGKINIVPLDGYLPGERVVLNVNTGLIGRPEQTAEGIRVRSLLNPKLVPGCLVEIDNASINQSIIAPGNKTAVAYNSWDQPQYLADVSADGIYRLYVVEHRGETRGHLMRKYGNLDHTLAAWNWGPGNLDRALSAGPPLLPAETRGFIDKVKAGMTIGAPQTTIIIQGAQDPNATARSVEAAQDRVNADYVRNIGGAVAQ